MSLFLVRGYDSDHDERLLKDQREDPEPLTSDEEGDDAGEGEQPEGGRSGVTGRDATSASDARGQGSGRSRVPAPAPAPKKGVTGLPSAAFAFSEVDDVPDFLRPAALAAQPAALSRAAASVAGITGAHSQVSNRGPGPTISSPALRNPDVGGGAAPEAERGDSGRERESAALGEHGGGRGGQGQAGRRAVGATLPPKEDAAILARVCESCQVPKAFSSQRGGMVCPLCHDRPKGAGAAQQGQHGAKKRDGATKDKEKMKRMKGQSSHATWKSETEMQLRQTYD